MQENWLQMLQMDFELALHSHLATNTKALRPQVNGVTNFIVTMYRSMSKFLHQNIFRDKKKNHD